jgi:hypothetical protein
MNEIPTPDPLRKLLSSLPEVTVRGNFTANVLREARQTPQERGWLAAMKAWWAESMVAKPLSLAGAAAAAIAITFVLLTPRTEVPSEALASTPVSNEAPAMLDDMPMLPETESAWEASLHAETLLAMQDASQFSDSDISFLLY